MEKKMITFLDAVGRTIIGVESKRDDSYVYIENPVIVNVVPQQIQDPNTGQVGQRMALQLYPLFFKEFLADKNGAVTFKYNLSNIAITDGDVIFDFKIKMQYDQLFAPMQITQAPPAEQTNKVIKLFDE